MKSSHVSKLNRALLAAAAVVSVSAIGMGAALADQVTIPVIVKTVPVNLPNYRNIVTQTKPENIVIAVDTQENIYFNNAPIQVNELRDRLLAKLKAVTNGVYPEVHIRADRGVRFEAVGRVILACQQAAIQKVGFITLPVAGGI